MLRLSEEKIAQHPGVAPDSTEIIRPGANRDAYWTNDDLVEQTKEKALPIFQILHPNCDALFMFDNSANHHAFAFDALVASRFNLKDGGVNLKGIMRDGWFMDKGNRITQTMANSDGQQKGLKSILLERKLWRQGIKKDDAVNLLMNQPDFLDQKEWLTETVLSEPGFKTGFFPKFHCPCVPPDGTRPPPRHRLPYRSAPPVRQVAINAAPPCPYLWPAFLCTRRCASFQSFCAAVQN